MLLLSCSILSNTGNTRAEGNLDRDVEKGWLFISRVGESTVTHLHESFTLRLDTFDWTRLWELELHLGGSQREVGTGSRVDLNVLV